MWNKEKAIEYLNSHANSASLGRCAQYTRKAIEAGGVTLIQHLSAKDYGPSLIQVGFYALDFDPTVYEAGDVVIIGTFTGNAHGHMAMFNGEVWVSDFKQRELYPGPGFRRHKPSYTIYRYPVSWDGVRAPLLSNLA
jgi:hypothetical protein